MADDPMLGVVAVIGLGVLGQWIALRLRLPSILVLLAVGFVAGPVTGLLHPDRLFDDLLMPFVSLAVGIILFEGGAGLRLRELREVRSEVRNLITVGAATTWLLSSLAARVILGMSWEVALLLGAILVVTGPTVIIPLLRQVRPQGPAGPMLKWEGILSDPIGALLAVLLYEGLVIGHASESSWFWLVGIGRTLLYGGGLGLAGGFLAAWLLRRYLVPDQLQSVFVLALVLAVFALSDVLSPESGLLAVTIMGMVVGNQRQVNVHHILSFKEQLTMLLLAVLFVVLAARVEAAALARLWLPSLAMLAVLVLVVRPAAVLLSTPTRHTAWRDRLFVASVAPRGIVAAAVSAFFALRLQGQGLEGVEQLAPVTFLLIVGTVVLYGVCARPLAIALGLAVREHSGLLVIGAGPFARALAEALRADGLEPVLVDRNRLQVRKARMMGLEAHVGDVLNASFLESLPMERVGRIMAMTPNSEVNALISAQLAEQVGRESVFQVQNAQERAREDDDDGHTLYESMRGRHFAPKGMTLAELESRLASGYEIHRTPLTEVFDADAYRRRYGAASIPLYVVRSEGGIVMEAADAPLQPMPGDILVHFAPPAADAPAAQR